MNSKIKELKIKIESNDKVNQELENELQLEYNKIFDKDNTLAKAIQEVELSNEYMGNEYGDILSWIRFDTEDYKDCAEYLNNWLFDYGISIDWKNDAMMLNHGSDNLMIQDDSRHKRDNGVWMNHNQVIPESDYTNEDGEVDTDKRNELIEAYMEKTGYFPGVFRIDYHGNIFAVNTQKKKE